MSFADSMIELLGVDIGGHIETEEEREEKKHVFEKLIICPICGRDLTVPVVKNNSPIAKKKDTDTFVEYERINPYFYEIWVCEKCGYAALKKDFEGIKKKAADKIKQDISQKWSERHYQRPYNVDIAIERFKLALLNYVVAESKCSQRAYVCLKLSWMYRIKGDIEKETLYRNRSIEEFKNAFYQEDFPFFGMDKSTVQYLIGELYRRSGNDDDALVWLGDVIVSRDASYRLRDKAKDQKDIIMRARKEPPPKKSQF